MKKRLKGPTWKKGQVLLPDVYHPPQELADPEAHLTEDQKKWPVIDGWAIPPEKYQTLSPDASPAEPQSKTPPAA